MFSGNEHANLIIIIFALIFNFQAALNFNANIHTIILLMISVSIRNLYAHLHINKSNNDIYDETYAINNFRFSERRNDFYEMVHPIIRFAAAPPAAEAFFVRYAISK